VQNLLNSELFEKKSFSWQNIKSFLMIGLNFLALLGLKFFAMSKNRHSA